MRLLHRLYARFFGYFWLPCPACGKMFGGHETGSRAVRIGGSDCLTCGCCDYLPLSFDESLARLNRTLAEADRVLLQLRSGQPREKRDPLIFGKSA